jgi:hypothetical protein
LPDIASYCSLLPDIASEQDARTTLNFTNYLELLYNLIKIRN